MTVELMSVVTIISVFFAVFFGINNARRNKSQDDKSDATLLTTLNVNQNVMQKSLDEIKFDVKGIRAEGQDMRIKLTALEQSCKSAHHRIDTLEGKKTDE